MLKKISMFALIMSVCGIATAGMPTTTMKMKSPDLKKTKIVNKTPNEKDKTNNLDLSRIESDISSIDKRTSDLEAQIAKIEECQKNNEELRTMINGVQQQLIDLQEKVNEYHK
ncbi:MAG: hypothetical protein GX944_00540 [Alphaproteobacteria bacterium]|nr:hypothetical protein [Alphaproteobacteria bacterium]